MTMTITQKDGVVYLSGVIDENSDFSTLLNTPPPLHLNFAGVERINSIGIRSWMYFLSKWEDKPLIYSELPVIISDQLAVIPALRGRRSVVADVLSAVIPYDCFKCDLQIDLRIEKSQCVPVMLPSATKPKCPHCGECLELVLEEQLSIFEK